MIISKVDFICAHYVIVVCTHQILHCKDKILHGNVRNLFSAHLGLWHPVKHAAESVWKAHAENVMGRLWHSVKPDMTLSKKPSVVQLLTFFVQLRMAWSSVRQKFHHDQSTNKGSSVDRNVRQQIIDLFDFFIPVVRSQISSLRLYIFIQ